MILSGFPDYPDKEEVAVTMQSSAYWPENETMQKFALRQAHLAALKAARSWENLCGYRPFLSDGQERVRRYSLSDVDHNGDLDFKNGLISLTSISIGGTLQTQDYSGCLYPLNADVDGLPFTRLQGAFGRGGRSYSLSHSGGEIAITGVWGYSTTVPEDVYDGLRLVAAQTVLQTIENLQSVGSISQDSFSKTYDITGVLTQTTLAGIWGKGFNTMVMQYWRAVS